VQNLLEETRDMTLRELSVRSASVDVEKRSFEAVVATEQVAQVFDWRSYDIIDEILVARGGEFPSSVVLLDDHQRYNGINSVIGSATGFRREGEQWIGTGVVGRAVEGNIHREQLWQDLQDGHIRAVSIGYQVRSYVDIPAGESQTINGRNYKAQERTLRVTTDWRVHELSLTPIGADSNALIRSKFQQRASLPDSEAEKETQRMSTTQEQVTAAVPAVDEATRGNVETVLKVSETRTNEPNAEQLRSEAAQAERSRILRINDLAEVANVPSGMRQKAIDEGVSLETAQETFLKYHRERSRMDVASGALDRAPAGHVASSVDRNGLVAALMLREGINDPTRCWPAYDEVVGSTRTRNAGSDAEVGRAVDIGNRLRGYSMIELCRHALALDGIKAEPTASGIAHAVQQARSSMAISKLTMTGVFTTSFSAIMVGSYEEAPDTTAGWTNERLVPNYLTNERTRMTAFENLAKRAKGKEADHAKASDYQETYKVSEYARQFVVDEQDLINDSFGALEEFSPVALGRAAARLRPDLVYAILLANAAMADGTTLFHANHGNLNTSSALAIGTLAAAIADVRKQTENSVNLNLMAKYLIVPADLQATAWALANSTLVIGGNTTNQPNLNPNAMSNLTVVSDARLDNGVVDPNTGTSHSGSATTWFMSAPGDGHTIEVGYIRELGRNPRVRTKVLDEGRFGLAFDVQHSVGAKAIDWRGLHKNTG